MKAKEKKKEEIENKQKEYDKASQEWKELAIPEAINDPRHNSLVKCAKKLEGARSYYDQIVKDIEAAEIIYNEMNKNLGSYVKKLRKLEHSKENERKDFNDKNKKASELLENRTKSSNLLEEYKERLVNVNMQIANLKKSSGEEQKDIKVTKEDEITNLIKEHEAAIAAYSSEQTKVSADIDKFSQEHEGLKNAIEQSKSKLEEMTKFIKSNKNIEVNNYKKEDLEQRRKIFNDYVNSFGEEDFNDELFSSEDQKIKVENFDAAKNKIQEQIAIYNENKTEYKKFSKIHENIDKGDFDDLDAEFSSKATHAQSVNEKMIEALSNHKALMKTISEIYSEESEKLRRMEELASKFEKIAPKIEEHNQRNPFDDMVSNGVILLKQIVTEQRNKGTNQFG